MNGDNGAGSETLLRLERALERILAGTAGERKLSVRAVEREAALGNGSASYYPEFVARVKNVKAQLRQLQQEQSQREQSYPPCVSCTLTMRTAEKYLRYRKENAELCEEYLEWPVTAIGRQDAMARALLQHEIDKEVVAQCRGEEVVMIKQGPAEKKGDEFVIALPRDETSGNTAAADAELPDEEDPSVS